MKTRSIILVLVASAVPRTANATDVVLNCLFDAEDGTKVKSVYFSGRMLSSPIRINAGKGTAEFYGPHPGGGAFAGGGEWKPFHNLSRIDATESSYSLEAEEVTEGRVTTSTTMVISRVSGNVRIRDFYPSLGKADEYTGACTPGQDPETIPPPKTMF